MLKFTSLDLQQRIGDVQNAALKEPVAVTFHGRPRNVMMSVEEFERLKTAAGESLPADLRKARAVTQRGLPDDSLGYETSDFWACAEAMADAALSGRNKLAVQAEISAVEIRALGAAPMTENPAHDDIGTNLRWRLLIPDNTPLSLLGLLGVEALDWLFVPGAEVWVTDMVREEALRDPDPGDDRRAEHRAIISDWFNRNRHRIRIQSTAEGLEYKKAMEVWRRAGSPPNSNHHGAHAASETFSRSSAASRKYSLMAKSL
jgi:hypothetical protein